MDISLKDIIQFVGQGGLSIVIFIIWYFTFTKADKTAQKAFELHEQLSRELIQQLKDEQEGKIMLIGILARLETKLDTPAQCPILTSGDKIRIEVMK